VRNFRVPRIEQTYDIDDSLPARGKLKSAFHKFNVSETLCWPLDEPNPRP
jgi:hypothetical protein